MFDILLFFEIALLTNVGSGYWVIFTLFCIEKAVKFFIWYLEKD